MGIKYEYDVDAHTTLCLTPSGGKGARLLEVFCFPPPRNQGFGLRCIGGGAGWVSALVDPELGTDEALQDLRALHAEVRDHGVQEGAFTRQSYDEDPSVLDGRSVRARKLEYRQNFLAKPVAMMVKGFGNEISVQHQPLYWQALWREHIELKPVVPAYQVALAIGRGTSDATVLRRLRRFIRHVERYGIAACNNWPPAHFEFAVFDGQE